MDENFSFFYPVIEEQQLDFDGRVHVKEILCEGHIVHNGRIMCGESMEVIRNRAKVKKSKLVKVRVEKVKVHVVCLEKYKKNGDSALSRWIEGKPIVPVSKLPPLNVPKNTG